MSACRALLLFVFLCLSLVVARPSAARTDPDLIVYSARYYRFRGPQNPSHYHLYTIRPDGRGRRQITFGKSDDEAPEWQPDRRHIRFYRRFANRDYQGTWCVLDVTTGKVVPTTPPPVHYAEPPDEEQNKIKTAVGQPCEVLRRDAGHLCAIVYDGMAFSPTAGGDAPTGIRELRIYDNAGNLQKTVPLSFPESERRWLKVQDRELFQCNELTPLPGEPDAFLLGAFTHRYMKGLEFRVDTRRGTVTFWSTSDPPNFSPDGRWYLTGSAEHNGFGPIGRRASGTEIVEVLSEIRIARTDRPNVFRTLVGGRVVEAGASWRPPATPSFAGSGSGRSRRRHLAGKARGRAGGCATGGRALR